MGAVTNFIMKLILPKIFTFSTIILHRYLIYLFAFFRAILFCGQNKFPEGRAFFPLENRVPDPWCCQFLPIIPIIMKADAMTSADLSAYKALLRATSGLNLTSTFTHTTPPDLQDTPPPPPGKLLPPGSFSRGGGGGMGRCLEQRPG